MSKIQYGGGRIWIKSDSGYFTDVTGMAIWYVGEWLRDNDTGEPYEITNVRSGERFRFTIESLPPVPDIDLDDEPIRESEPF